MPEFKLWYFNARGRAETARLLFAQAGVEFEDKRLESPFDNPSSWAETRKSLPIGQVPVLEVDGCQVTQSNAIALYLADLFGLSGATNTERRQVYEVFFLAQELLEAGGKVRFEKDETRKAEMKKNFEEVLFPRNMAYLSNLLGDKEFFACQTVTVADLQVFEVLEHYARAAEIFPKILEHNQRVKSLPKISSYLAKRPVTEF